MTPSRTPSDVFARLTDANARVAAAYPGERGDRQPVHTVYGGAHLFTHDVASRMGEGALRAMETWAPDFGAFARALGMTGHDAMPRGLEDLAEMRAKLERDPAAAHREHRDAWLAHAVWTRVRAKLATEPVEDYRVDFEDGYGVRPDDEEDAHADAVALAFARGLAERTLPPFSGIRVKAFTEELGRRSLRTLERLTATLVTATGGVLPPNFTVVLPKITAVEQVEAFTEVLELLEQQHRLPPGAFGVELMVETTQSLLGPDGRVVLPALVGATRGRCRGAHLGVYDYTASLGITAAHQHPRHPACDAARQLMKLSLAGTGVSLSDGSTAVLPVPRHDGPELDEVQRAENVAAVHHAWRVQYEDVRHALVQGFYQGWDLHPAQLPARYAAVYAFFLEARANAAERLRRFVDQAAQATRLGQVFDDAATGQALLNFFVRGIACGAIDEEEALATGLTLEELRGRSFVKILEARRSAGRVTGA